VWTYLPSINEEGDANSRLLERTYWHYSTFEIDTRKAEIANKSIYEHTNEAYLDSNEAWGSVVVKAQRYWSDGPGIDSRWCHWGIFPWLPPAEPCALRSTQSLKVSTRDFSWDKGGRWVRLTNYDPRSAETSRKSGALIYPEPLGPPRETFTFLILIVIKGMRAVTINEDSLCTKLYAIKTYFVCVCVCVCARVCAWTKTIYIYIYIYI